MCSVLVTTSVHGMYSLLYFLDLNFFWNNKVHIIMNSNVPSITPVPEHNDSNSSAESVTMLAGWSESALRSFFEEQAQYLSASNDPEGATNNNQSDGEVNVDSSQDNSSDRREIIMQAPLDEHATDSSIELHDGQQQELENMLEEVQYVVIDSPTPSEVTNYGYNYDLE